MTEGAEPAPYTEGTHRYAGFWIRFVAFIIDGILLGFVGSVINAMVGAGGPDPVARNVAGLIGFLIGVAYYVYMESSTRQATFGKLAVGLKVTDLQGNRIAAGTAALRYFSKLLSALILLIGFIMAAFTPKKQALHDIIAKTLILKR